jgi:hypothetical protein
LALVVMVMMLRREWADLDNQPLAMTTASLQVQGNLHTERHTTGFPCHADKFPDLIRRFAPSTPGASRE